MSIEQKFFDTVVERVERRVQANYELHEDQTDDVCDFIDKVIEVEGLNRFISEDITNEFFTIIMQLVKESIKEQ